MSTQKLDRSLVKLVVILLLGAVPSLLDSTIVNVAIDTIGRDLHTTVSAIQWVITGYLLSFGMVIPLERLGAGPIRRAGPTWIFLSLVAVPGRVRFRCPARPGTSAALIGFRRAAGDRRRPAAAGAHHAHPAASSGGQSSSSRGWMAAISLPVAVVPILGPVLSGLIISNVSWRWIFFVNVPMCLAAIALAWRGLPAGRAEPPAPAARRLDVTGLLLLCPALAGLLYGLAEVSRPAAGSGHLQVLLPLLAGAALLAGFSLGTCMHTVTAGAAGATCGCSGPAPSPAPSVADRFSLPGCRSTAPCC